MSAVRTATEGREYAPPTGCFRAAEFKWPLSSDEFEEQTDAARPQAVSRPFPEWTLHDVSLAQLLTKNF